MIWETSCLNGCPLNAGTHLNSLYILRCPHDNLCGGRCEQWQNNGEQWVFVEPWITGAARIGCLYKDLRGKTWPDWNRFPGVAPLNISWSCYISSRFSALSTRESSIFLAIFDWRLWLWEGDRFSRWSWRDVLFELTHSIVLSCQCNLTQ